MITFLVNNDYQLISANVAAQDLKNKGCKVGLIIVEHTINTTLPRNLYSSTKIFKSPLKRGGWLRAWGMYIFYYYLVRKIISPAEYETLIVFTELEPLNHLLINRFHNAGAKIVHIEDGGIGTYLPFSTLEVDKMSIRDWIIAIFIKSIPGLFNTNLKKINKVLFYWRPDRCIDLLITYRNFKCSREIKTLVIRRYQNQPVKNINLGRVIFLNECIYDFYQTKEDYLKGLNKILHHLLVGYGEVYFKFHPREAEEMRNEIQQLILMNYPKIHIISEELPVELLIERYAPEALASYISTPLFNLDGTGIEPLFLYHLIDDLCRQPFFEKLTELLKGWDYQFVKSWEWIRSGYKAGFYEPTSNRIKKTLYEVLMEGALYEKVDNE